MNKQNAVPKTVMFQEVVKIKKLRFPNTEDSSSNGPKSTKDAILRQANFEEFKAVYGDSFQKIPPKNLKNEPSPLKKTKSGSLYRFPKVKSEPQYVETINIELPIHFGAERAVHQLPPNKIKPKRSYLTTHREMTTETISQRLHKIEEVEETQRSATELIRQIDVMQQRVDSRKESTWRKTLPKVSVVKGRKKYQPKDKIMSELASINEKLEKMQKKYYDQPRVQYKSVNDCFTQSGYLEVIYANQKYPEKVTVSSDMVECGVKNRVSSGMVECAMKNTVSSGIVASAVKKTISSGMVANAVRNVSTDTVDFKTEKSVKEMDKILPEFPKMEDTLRDIEAHLDNIVNLETDSGNPKTDTTLGLEIEDQLSKYCGRGTLAAILASLEQQYSPLDHTTSVLRNVEEVRDEKLNSIRQQIEVVEEFCDRISEIAQDESDAETVSTGVSDSGDSRRGEYRDYINPAVEDEPKEVVESQSRTADVADFMEGPDLETSIKKSVYLSREFANYKEYTSQPMVKVFSDSDQQCRWRNRMKSMNQMGKMDLNNEESVMKLVDDLKFTLEHSVYELVA